MKGLKAIVSAVVLPSKVEGSLPFSARGKPHGFFWGGADKLGHQAATDADVTQGPAGGPESPVCLSSFSSKQQYCPVASQHAEGGGPSTIPSYLASELNNVTLSPSACSAVCLLPTPVASPVSNPPRLQGKSLDGLFGCHFHAMVDAMKSASEDAENI